MAKFCTNCGNELADAAVICPKCGVPVNNSQSKSVQSQTNVMAIIGFVASFILPPVGIVLSAIGLRKADEIENGKGLAIAGLILSILGTILIIIITMIAIISINGAMNDAESSPSNNLYDYYDNYDYYD